MGSARHTVCRLWCGLLVAGAVAVVVHPSRAYQPLPKAEFAVVADDSVGMWTRPDPGRSPARWAHLGDQFRVIGLSRREDWCRVSNRLYQEYPSFQTDTCWIRAKDLHFESPQISRAMATPDLILLQVPPGSMAHRVGARQYMSDPASLPDSFYVSANHAPDGPREACGSPYLTCAEYIPPGHEIYRSEDEDSTRFRVLYTGARIIAVCRLESNRKFGTLRERLYISRSIFDHYDCYSGKLIRTERQLLVDSTMVVNAWDPCLVDPLPSEILWRPHGAGEAGGALLTWVIDFSPAKFPQSSERLVRSISISWPACM